MFNALYSFENKHKIKEKMTNEDKGPTIIPSIVDWYSNQIICSQILTTYFKYDRFAA